ncbi:MAG TPA: ankyrin repeat domain-containing protein, partial [Elusimicrobiota bacterium]|nr:ankyrin repeat domain-containing protein [Elusimicrobiota bacterium]
PIVWAASAGDVALVRWLAEHGWNVNTTAQCDLGTPLSAAAGAGRAEVVDYLLKKGANPELPCDQVTPLQQAQKMNQAGTARQIQTFIARRFDDVSEAAAEPAPAAEPASAPAASPAAPAAKTANWWEK